MYFCSESDVVNVGTGGENCAVITHALRIIIAFLKLWFLTLITLSDMPLSLALHGSFVRLMYKQ